MAEAPGMPLDWSVYVVRCGDGSLYTGIAKDVADRIERHNAGKGAAYTRSRRPVLLLYSETGLTRSQALVREARIKSLPRNKKESLVLNNGDAADRARTRA
ncbi:MAG: GIY-YIG nuclease family protein [Elusimicrobia bacterium]|nr:GIY-YIG nuclease family protein [Elusimicrobiota bacterium]